MKGFLSDERASLCIEQGLAYLHRQQHIDGSFLSLSSDRPDSFTHAHTFHSVFSTSLILFAVSSLSLQKDVHSIKTKAIAFLLGQRSTHWTWNYWARESEEAQQIPYPDDLDDTCCALSALYMAAPEIITGEVFAALTQVLTALEVHEGGPYRTWLVGDSSPDVWKDVDLVVNANIAFCLKQQDIVLPRLTRLFGEAVKRKQLHSPYYPTVFPIIYFLSRAVTHKKHKQILLQYIGLQHPQSAVDNALLCLAREELDDGSFDTTANIEHIVANQQSDGSWLPTTFYTGVNPTGKTRMYAGSAALSTALCILVIDRWRGHQHQSAVKKQLSPIAHKLQTKVLQLVQRRFRQLGPTLQIQANRYLEQIVRSDSDYQIRLLPYFFTHAYGSKLNVSESTLVALGAANVFGWLAYTIYDNFLDEEATLSSLPLANVSLRELTILFHRVLPENSGFDVEFGRIMDQLEEVNTWEVTHCRLSLQTKLDHLVVPDFGNLHVLADRSFGHALGPLALMMASGYTADAPEMEKLRSFFTHLLIARQLNDDAHDWWFDLSRGQINAIGGMVIVRSKQMYPSYRITPRLKNKLHQIFWQDLAEDVCTLIESHTSKARRALESCTFLQDVSLFESIVDKQDSVVRTTRRERQNALLFLQHYSENHA